MAPKQPASQNEVRLCAENILLARALAIIAKGNQSHPDAIAADALATYRKGVDIDFGPLPVRAAASSVIIGKDGTWHMLDSDEAETFRTKLNTAIEIAGSNAAVLGDVGRLLGVPDGEPRT